MGANLYANPPENLYRNPDILALNGFESLVAMDESRSKILELRHFGVAFALFSAVANCMPYSLKSHLGCSDRHEPYRGPLEAIPGSRRARRYCALMGSSAARPILRASNYAHTVHAVMQNVGFHFRPVPPVHLPNLGIAVFAVRIRVTKN
jgi:hypothetical protein